jgi:uncharacterized membrane protein (DUF485 family)
VPTDPPPDGHTPASTPPHFSIARNARYGIVLFLIYSAFYAGFVALSVFAPQDMKSPVNWLGGVNVAIAYGMGLIVLALVLAAIYLFATRSTGESDRGM